MPLFSCAAPKPSNLGVAHGVLAPCLSSPNCVSSDATDKQHGIAPLVPTVEPAEAWAAARDAVTELARTRILAESDGYLHAECRSALLGFVDDLELHLRAADGIIAMRSASRVGRSDLGVNRDRVEGLRTALIERGVVQAAD